MEEIKKGIETRLAAMTARNEAFFRKLTDVVSLTEYESLCREGEIDGQNVKIWTDALEKALAEHEVIKIPASCDPYLIDGQIVIPSNRRIEAEKGAVIRQAPGVTILMFRNEHVVDGSFVQTDPSVRDVNISICGGRWEESWRSRAGYGRTGKYDEAHSMNGVSTMMLFAGVNSLSLTDMEFAYTAGFSVQIGNASDVWCENIHFDTCYADGLHINGNTENIVTRHISGEVGDDLVALNMYDWDNSSINFGPMKNVLCEDLDQAETSRYKAMRIQPGVYFFKDDTSVDCKAENIIVRKVRGIINFKLYLQTPGYSLKNGPSRAAVGSGGNLFFEDIDIDVYRPIDQMPNYMESDPVTGFIAAFEIGSNLTNVSFENINLTLHRDRFPQSYLLNIGPKSYFTGEYEVFDPYVKCKVDCVRMKNIKVNGEIPEDISDYVKIVKFDRIYDSDLATGEGKLGKLEYIR